AVGHLAAFYVALRRNTVGIDGSPLLRDGWQPPAPSLALLAVVAAAVVALVVALVRIGGSVSPTRPARPTSDH
ncbi:MAG: hypothetical protein ACKO91_18950, partial [Acidimicrobiales bacterium]